MKEDICLQQGGSIQRAALPVQGTDMEHIRLALKAESRVVLEAFGPEETFALGKMHR